MSACSGRNYNFRCINVVFGVFLRETARPVGGGFMGSQFPKVLGGCQTTEPIGTKFGTRLRIRLGMDIG